MKTKGITGTMANASLSSREAAQPTLDMMGLSASVSSGIDVECTHVPVGKAETVLNNIFVHCTVFNSA